MNESPRLASRLLAWTLPTSDQDEIIGDLEEQFVRLASDQGRASARRWYLRQALALALSPSLRGARFATKSATRSALSSMDDVRFAVRRLRKQPGATAAAIATLAVAIGASAAAWSMLTAVLVRPLPVDAPERLMVVGTLQKSDNRIANSNVYPLYPAVRDSGVFHTVAAGGSWSLLVASAGFAESRLIHFVSDGFFDVLGVRPRMGRAFSRDDDRAGAPLVAILSDRYWRRAFAEDPGVIGRTLTVSGKTATIIGVAPSGFRGTSLVEAPDLYLPLHTIADVSSPMINYFADGAHNSSPTSWVRVFARLRPGMTVAEAVKRLEGLRVGERETQIGLTDINTAALPEALRGGMARFGLLLATAVGLLLLIGCLSVGMLLLLRTEARRDEFALCVALGASRVRLVVGIILDGLLLAIAGATGALPVSLWLFMGLSAFHLPGGVDIGLLDLRLDLTAFLAAVLLALLTTLVVATLAGAFGLVANTADVLRTRGGATPRVARRWTRASLVVAQVAVSLVLLSGAALFIRSLVEALALNPGFETTRIATTPMSLGGHGYSAERATAFFSSLRDQLSLHPSMRSVSIVSPRGGMGARGKITIDGERRVVPSSVAEIGVDQHYFETMGLTLTRGRAFTGHDRTGAPLVVIVSESYARFIANGGDARGHRITANTRRIGQAPDVFEVVGIVPDVVTSVEALEPLVMYMPVAQLTARPEATVVIRARSDVAVALGVAMSAIRTMDRALPPATFLTMEEGVARQMSAQKFGAAVMSGLGAIAALLTLFGTYVLVESMSALRLREMGVRAVLGATRRELCGLVLTETLRLIGCGLGLGLLLAWSGAGMIRSFLFRVQPFDLPTIGGVLAAILLLALAVAMKPALRAAQVDLARVLREE